MKEIFNREAIKSSVIFGTALVSTLTAVFYAVGAPPIRAVLTSIIAAGGYHVGFINALTNETSCSPSREDNTQDCKPE